MFFFTVAVVEVVVEVGAQRHEDGFMACCMGRLRLRVCNVAVFLVVAVAVVGGGAMAAVVEGV